MILSRKDILEKAIGCVGPERYEKYGEPEDNFQIIADLWRAYMGIEFTPADVAVMMILLKVARIGSRQATIDSFVDVAGYAACGGEIMSREQAERLQAGGKNDE